MLVELIDALICAAPGWFRPGQSSRLAFQKNHIFPEHYQKVPSLGRIECCLDMRFPVMVPHANPGLRPSPCGTLELSSQEPFFEFELFFELK